MIRIRHPGHEDVKVGNVINPDQVSKNIARQHAFMKCSGAANQSSPDMAASKALSLSARLAALCRRRAETMAVDAVRDVEPDRETLATAPHHPESYRESDGMFQYRHRRHDEYVNYLTRLEVRPLAARKIRTDTALRIWPKNSGRLWHAYHAPTNPGHVLIRPLRKTTRSGAVQINGR